MAADPNTNQSENGNASETMSVAVAAVDYTAYYPPPPGPSEKKPSATPNAAAGHGGGELTPAQAEMHNKVLEHFQSESYKLPGVQDGELMAEEKFWLVRFFFLFFRERPETD
jgi:hypothetical protein